MSTGERRKGESRSREGSRKPRHREIEAEENRRSRRGANDRTISFFIKLHTARRDKTPSFGANAK